jgi:hypothetical protein
VTPVGCASHPLVILDTAVRFYRSQTETQDGNDPRVTSGSGSQRGSHAPPNCAIFHSNQYHAQAACDHCSGVIRHEPWCITRNQLVYCAYETVLDPGQLTLTDRLILHALGVRWTKECTGTCSI